MSSSSASRVLQRRQVLRGRVIDVGVERVVLPGDREVDLEILRHPGASAIVPVTDRGEIVLIRQYRHAALDYLWEIPAGTRESSEEPLVCARRELTEETGFVAHAWTGLGEMLPAPGYTTERIHLFLATGLEQAVQDLDADEVISEVRAVPADTARAWSTDGTIVDAKTIVGIHRALEGGFLATPGPTP